MSRAIATGTAPTDGARGVAAASPPSTTVTAPSVPSDAIQAPAAATSAPSIPSSSGTSGTSGTSAGSSNAAVAPRASRALAGRRRRENVAVVLFGGGPILESSIPLSVFGVDRQEAGVPRYRLLVCAGEQGPLSSTGGVTLSAPYSMEAVARAGTVVVPAWRSVSAAPPPEVLDALRLAHAEGARVVGLCTGAFVLAAAGLLDGRGATTHWMYAPTLAKRYPNAHIDPRESYVDDGGVLTSAGTASGIELCLHLVRNDHGADAAGALARRLVLPARRQETRASTMDRSLPEEMGGDPLAEVVAWALDHLHEQFDVETLASRAYMSRRTFDRRFRTLTGSAPLQWLITQRVLQAQRLLETGDHPIDEVAQRCGFRSPVALRGHFRRQLGVSPATYRTTVRARRAEAGDTVPDPAEAVVDPEAVDLVDEASSAATPGGMAAGTAASPASEPAAVPEQRHAEGAPGGGRPTPPGVVDPAEASARSRAPQQPGRPGRGETPTGHAGRRSAPLRPEPGPGRASGSQNGSAVPGHRARRGAP